MNNQKGSILIFSVLIMGVILTMTLSLGNIFLPRLRTATEAVNSTLAGYAADSALEWCLYVNRKNPVPASTPLPTLDNGSTVVVYRGNTTVLADCYENTGLNHRAVGTYRGVTRSFTISE